MKSRLCQIIALGAAGIFDAGLGCSPSGEVGPAEQLGAADDSLLAAAAQVYAPNSKLGHGRVCLDNAFFQSFGTNGRTCNSCHKLENTMGISTDHIQRIFALSGGTDPIFRTNDGSNSPTGVFADTSTLAARSNSFSMLLNHGVIRIGLGMPNSADFQLISVQDPYSFASAHELSLFRRPMPSANVAFNTLTMWDGRASEDGRTVNRDALLQQAADATRLHAQAIVPLTEQQKAEIADFQLDLFSAQLRSSTSGYLDRAGCAIDQTTGGPCRPARGGAVNLAAVLTSNPGGVGGPRFFPGINDPLMPGFNNKAFTIYASWESAVLPKFDTTALTKNRGDVGDGENLFNTKPFTITEVPGLTDVPGQPTSRPGFCTTCHNSPDVGNLSSAHFMNIGTADVEPNPLFGPDYPVYEFEACADGTKKKVTDPGVGLRTGKFTDIGKFKVPNLRGLGSRAPYFHNGSAKTLLDVVNFYNLRFKIGYTPEEIRKLVLFLQQT